MSHIKMWLKYNYFFERDGICLFYNSLTNSFVRLSEQMYRFLSGFKAGEEVKIENKPLEENLKRMKAIVDDDRLEIRKIRYANTARRFQSGGLYLTLNPTLGCNFACPYCFEEGKKAVRMDDETEDRIIELIKKSEPKRIGVTWFGGEPLLEIKRILSLTNRILDTGIAYSANMISNGYLLTEEVARQLEKLKIKSIQITLDGTKELHDSRRYLKNGMGTFDRIYNNIEKCAELAPNVAIGIRVNIDKTNFTAFMGVYNLIGRRWKNVRVYPAFVSDINAREQVPCMLNVDERFAYMKNLSREYGLDYNKFYPDASRLECSVRSRNTLVIGPEGELYKCWNDVGKPEMVYGTLKEGVTNERVLYDYLAGADPFEDEVCKECIMLPICPGGCPHARLVDEQNGTRNACPLNVRNLRDYLWEHYNVIQKRNENKESETV